MELTSKGLPKITQRTLNTVMAELADPENQASIAESWCQGLNGKVLKAYLVAATEEMSDEERNNTRTFMAGVYRLLEEEVKEFQSQGGLYSLPEVKKPAFDKAWAEIRSGPITIVMNGWLDSLEHEDGWMSIYFNFIANALPTNLSDSVLARMAAVYRMLEIQSEDEKSVAN